MTYQCEMQQVDPQPVLSVRTRLPFEQLPDRFGQAITAVMSYLQELGAAPTGVPFVAYYNVDVQDLDVEMGYPVAGDLPGRGDVQPGTVPGGKIATCVFTGHYHEMGPAYEALTQWVQANGYEPTGVMYEFYLNNPDEIPPEQWQTQIVYLLK